MLQLEPTEAGNEIPQAANRVVGWVRYRVRAADRVVGAELLVVCDTVNATDY